MPRGKIVKKRPSDLPEKNRIENELKALSGLDIDNALTEISWFAGQGVITMREVLTRVHEEWSRAKKDLAKTNQSVDHPTFHLAMLALGASKVHIQQRSDQMKKRLSELESNEIGKRKRDRFSRMRKKKKAPKAMAIKNQFFHLITQLRNDGWPWLDIIMFLDTEYKFKVTREYLTTHYTAAKNEYDAADKSRETTEVNNV